ncbi:MAG: ribonuclease P protein component [Acidobacteriota bacterium]|nr:ribonuclease P protein component [Acidobacteriota bacterium]
MPGRVRTRRRFALFATPSARGQSGPLRILFVAGDGLDPRVDVAFAISRRHGGAVVRNRIRRRLRALIDGLDPRPRPGSYLIRCGNETGKLTYDQLQHHLTTALGRAGLL